MQETNEKKYKNKIIILIIFLVILVIAVISGLVYQKFIRDDNEIKEIPLENQISEYEGEKISGEEVKLLLAKIMNDNLSDSEARLLKIEYEIMLEYGDVYSGNIELNTEEQNTNIQDIVNLRNNIENEKKYNVEYGKEKDIIVYISIKN